MVAWRALDDEPLSADDWRYLDAGRLRPTVDTLTHHFRCWLGLVKEPGPGPMCVGLFGGLGQGKSTAVRAALDEARQSPPRLPQLLSRIFCGRAHHTFNVSQFTADDLEWRLMASVLLRRSLRNIGVLLGCLTLAFVVATLWLSRFHDVSLGAITFHGTKSALKWLLPDAIEGWLKGSMQSRTVGSLMVWTLVTAALGYLFGRLLTQPFHQRARDVVVMGLARMTFAVPRILIVDDLDRADVRQQRAFLRALHRWSTTDHLLWGVVVCMDDSALMTSPAAPESPESLILKCLQLVLRLPDRQREDVVVLVLSCSELARRRNPDFAPLLCNVQWLASLVRVLLASAKPSAIGPRLVKHMVNDVMVQCHGQMNRCWPADSDAPDWAADLDDWCALLRLDALLRLVPELRHDMPAVMRALEANTETELSKLFDVRRFELQDRRRADGFEYLLSTRMLQPGHREGWFGLLVDGRRELDPTSRTASAPTIDPLAALDLAVVSGEVYRYTQLFCALIDLGRIGHLQNDHLHPRGNFGLGAFDFNHAGFRASVPVRKSDTLRNRRDGLPSSWTSNGAIQRGTHALLHEWLCWVAVLATTERPARHEVLRQLPVWLSPLRAEQASHLLTRLVTTERMTHAEHWRRLDPTSQVDLMTQDAALGRRALYMVAMDDTHLHMVVRQLQAGTAPLHPRKALTVLGAFGKPGALGKYLGASAVGGAAPSPSTVLDKAAIALVWPAPVRSGATDSEWADALRDKTLTDVLRASWWENSVPQTWLSGWQRAAGNQLSTADCLQLLCRVAKEPGALGGHWAWSTDRLKPWLPIAADGEPRGWPVTLEAIRTEGQAWEGSGMSADADSWLIGLLVCAQLRWVPSALLLAGAEKAASAHDMHAAVWALLRLAPEPNEGGLVSATGPSGWVVRCLRHAKSAADRAEDSLLVEALARCFGIDEALVMLRDAGWPVPDVHDSEVPD